MPPRNLQRSCDLVAIHKEPAATKVMTMTNHDYDIATGLAEYEADRWAVGGTPNNPPGLEVDYDEPVIFDDGSIAQTVRSEEWRICGTSEHGTVSETTYYHTRGLSRHGVPGVRYGHEVYP